MSIQPTTLPAPCYRCLNDDISWVPNLPTDGLCRACRAEVQANRDDARDELVSLHYSGHGLGHHYRSDVAL